MYLYLAIFWLVAGVVAQIFWETLEQHAYIPVSRTVFGIIFFVLFTFNFLRWRMSRSITRAQDDLTPPPKPRVVHREHDPTFDFSDNRETKPPTT